MKNAILVLAVSFILLAGCVSEEPVEKPPVVVPEEVPVPEEPEEISSSDYPKIAIWLAKKDEVIASGKPYDLVMTAWFTPEEASQIREQNPDVKLFAGLTTNWIFDNEGWKLFLETVASHGNDEPYELTEEMYLKNPNGSKCAFGWESEEWNHEEIYAMDPRNEEWRGLVFSFYGNVLDQPEHDGIIVDMVVEKQWWCPEAISDGEWEEATKEIFAELNEMNTEDKPIIFNAGLQFTDIDAYAQYMDGYVLENFLGEWGADYDTGLEAADSDYIVVYAVDTDDTGIQDTKRMRLGLTLSLLNDNTYFAYDFGPRDHGGAWWYPEYDVDLGEPLDDYYKKDNAYWREFENGVVVSSPYSSVDVVFDEEHTDATSGVTSKTFTVEKEDGRIFTGG